MKFTLENYNLKESYPLVAMTADLTSYYEKETGLDFNIIDIETISDLISLDSAAKASDPNYNGMFITGNKIALLRNGESYNK